MRVACPFGNTVEAPKLDINPSQTPTFWYKVGNYVLEDGNLEKPNMWQIGKERQIVIMFVNGCNGCQRILGLER
jgi:hypothetical protein